MCLQIDIIDDDIYEEDQQFSVSITAVSPSTVALIGTESSVTKTIQDNNGTVLFMHVCTQHSCTASDAEVAFVMDEYTVGEEFGNVGVCVDTNVTDGFQTDLTVFLSAIDGKASECICLEHSLDYVPCLHVDIFHSCQC